MSTNTVDTFSQPGTTDRLGPNPLSQRCLEGLQLLLGDYQTREFRVRLWDDTTIEPSQGHEARFTLSFHHPAGLRRFLTASSQVGLAEGYIFDDYDIDGDLLAVMPTADFLMSHPLPLKERAHLARLLFALPHDRPAANERIKPRLMGWRHSRSRDRQAIGYHYDVSNEFYALWLDSRMVYSCAYFAHPDEDIDLAQHRKIDYVCRKLRLTPGERLLDIGCGWGALILHACQNYGVEAVGVTLSHKQAALARERIRAAGLEGRCRVELCDYRDFDEHRPFDKLVSIGMFEHVGVKRFQTYFRKAWQLLKPGGIFLNHAIAEPYSEEGDGKPTLVSTYVFPDGELVPLAQAQNVAEQVGFEVRDVESLREHYELTLRRWVKRLEAHHDDAIHYASEPIYRIWRLYMAGAAHAFAEGRLHIYQSLYSKNADRGLSFLPLSRADWYTDQERTLH